MNRILLPSQLIYDHSLLDFANQENMEKIFITGAYGLLGTALVNHLYKKYKVFDPTSRELNLLDKKAVKYYVKNNGPFHCVYHLAAKVGGVKANTLYPTDFFNENIQMNINVLEACKNNKAGKVISMLSTCIYPDSAYVKYPLTEDQLHLGPPHSSNFAYAYAKRMLDIQSKAYRQEFGLDYICVIPNNLFGEYDNYHLDNGHVIPSLIRKIYEAKTNNQPTVEIWGSGKPLREFTYSKDVARILEIVSNEYDGVDPINIGNPLEYSITDVAEAIKTALGYDGTLVYNTDKPEGQFRKNSSNENLLKHTSWKNEHYTNFHTAIKNSCDWFVRRYPNVRGI